MKFVFYFERSSFYMIMTFVFPLKFIDFLSTSLNLDMNIVMAMYNMIFISFIYLLFLSCTFF